MSHLRATTALTKWSLSIGYEPKSSRSEKYIPMLNWIKTPRKQGWYWIRRRSEDNPSVYFYHVMRVGQCVRRAELVDADDPLSVPLTHDSYAKHEWAGPLVTE